MKIGLLGCLINNENLGCQALTYSVLALLEDIQKERGEQFTYYIFETNPDQNITAQAGERLHIAPERIRTFDVRPMFRLRRFIHHFSVGCKTLKAMSACDAFIDMTGGDSFTDLYGQYTFDSETNVKYLVKRLGKKLILGPQTYGPFQTEKNRNKAMGVINRADLVISRDRQSQEYIAGYTDKHCHVTTDVAFRLPYEKPCAGEAAGAKKIKVGINVSGLLIKDKTESTSFNTPLKADYEQYICSLIDALLADGSYEIHIIPHVGMDGVAWVKKQYGEQLTYHQAFGNPMDAKSLIAGMDLFIGSRMHATIGAFSAGVPTIPVAYSRKFSGLFEHLNYPYVVDLTEKTAQECLDQTLKELKEHCLLRETMIGSQKIWQEETAITKHLIAKTLSAGSLK